MIIGKGLRQKLKRLSTNKNYRHRYCRSLSLKNVNIALHIFLLVYTKNSEENSTWHQTLGSNIHASNLTVRSKICREKNEGGSDEEGCRAV